MPSRFVNKAALTTTNCFGLSGGFIINRRSQHVLNGPSFHWSGLTGFNRRPKASTLLLTIQNCICVSLICISSLARSAPLRPFSLYTILFHYFSVCKNQSSLNYPRPLALPTLLQCCCATFAQYITSPRPSLHMPYTIQYW